MLKFCGTTFVETAVLRIHGSYNFSDLPFMVVHDDMKWLQTLRRGVHYELETSMS